MDKKGGLGRVSGFTLIESLIVISITGILATVSVPNFFGMYQKTKVDSALTTLNGAFQEAQREAMRKSKDCTITLSASGTTNPTISSPCFTTGNRTLTGVTLRHNRNSSPVNQFRFDYRGGSDFLGTMVISSATTPHQRCFVVSNGIGMTRIGYYDRRQTSNALASYCDQNP